MRFLKTCLMGIILSCILAISLYAQQTKDITISAQNEAVVNVMRQIEKQSGYLFFYDDDTIDSSARISFQIKAGSLKATLDEFCRSLKGVKYQIVDKTIILSKELASKTESPKSESSVRKRLRGRVVDVQGLPIPGAAIMGPNANSIADIDGYFELNVAQGAKVVVACMGFMQVEANADLSLDPQVFVLKEDFMMLDEIIFVGYGSQKKSDVTGAIASVKAEDLNRTPTISIGEMLRGAAAGVQVRTNSSEPGGSATVLIRGRRSLSADNSPLYIVDGVPMTSIDDINSAEIESMEVLKDASSQSVYGARAANGVILISTKRGVEGKAKVSYSGYMAMQDIHRNFEFYNGEEWAAYRKEAYIQAYGSYDQDSCFPGLMGQVMSTKQYVDWEKLMIHKALQQKHDVLIQSGNDKTKFVVGLGSYNQNGMVINSGFDKVSGRINIDHKISNSLSIGANLTYSQSWKQSADGSFNTFITMPPIAMVYQEDGSLKMDVTEAGESHYNPLWNINNSDYRTNVTRQLYNIFLDWKILPGLKYRLNTSMNKRSTKAYKYVGRDHTSAIAAGYLGKADVTISENNDYLVENILNYSTKINQNHSLDFTLMQSVNYINYNSLGISGTDFANDDLLFNAIGSALNYGVPTYGLSERKMLSYLGRVSYNYKDKYLFTLASRVDGSSVFGAKHKYGVFPSASFAWRINQEEWFKSINWVSNLKFRASIGQVGNQGVSPYTTLGLSDKYLTEFDKTAIGYLPDTSLSNPDLKWETSTSANLGLDFGLFKGRVSGSLELYNTKTTDLLIYKSLSNSTGYLNQLVNLGAVQNKGIELSLNTVPVTTADFEWTLDFTFSKNVNKILKIDGSLDIDGKPRNDVNNNWFIGSPMNVYYDYQFDGIWQVGDEISTSSMPNANPGDIKIKDIDGNHTINADDRIILKRDPDWIGSVSTSLSYKSFDVSAELYLSMGGYIYNEYLTSFATGGDMTGKRNGLRRNYWTVNNPSNEAPAPNMTQAPAYITALGYQDASYIRLRNVQLGYTLPKKVAKSIKMDKFRMYVTLTNLLTKTEVLAYGPEANTGAYPEPRTILFGLNLGF